MFCIWLQQSNWKFSINLRSKNSLLELNNFHEIFSGFELLRLCYIDKSDILKMYQKVDQSKICFNKSSSLNQIEFNYVYGFLGLQATEENFF